MKRKILFALLLFAAPALQADYFQPTHMCIKPFKPFQFNYQWEVDSYNTDVQMYKQCILDFVEEQEQAIRTHQMAAEEAIEEWNWFVQFEIN